MHISINNSICKHSTEKIVAKILEVKWIWKRDLMVDIGNFAEKSPFVWQNINCLRESAVWRNLQNFSYNVNYHADV